MNPLSHGKFWPRQTTEDAQARVRRCEDLEPHPERCASLEREMRRPEGPFTRTSFAGA
jgi:hypothetical protein